MLSSFVHTNHYNWLASLSLAEFAYNNNFHSSIGHSPFVANYGFVPRTPYNLIEPQIDMIPQQNNDNVLQRLMTVENLIVDQLKISSEIQTSHADRNYTPKQFNVSERVMLSTQNLKLRSCYIVPY